MKLNVYIYISHFTLHISHFTFHIPSVLYKGCSNSQQSDTLISQSCQHVWCILWISYPNVSLAVLPGTVG